MDQSRHTPTPLADFAPTEEAFRESAERLDLALRGTRDGFWDWSAETGQLFLSPRWLDILGYDTENLKPHLEILEEICHPDDAASLKDSLSTLLAGHSAGKMEIEHRVRAKSGEWKWILTRAVVGRLDKHGKALRIGGTITHITDRKQAEEELREHGDLLDEMVAQRTLELAEANAQLQFDIARRKQAEEKLQESNEELLRSYQARGEHVRILTCLVEFCRAIGASQSLDTVLNHTSVAVAELAHCRRISIMLPDEGAQYLRIIESRGMDEERAAAVRVPIGEPIAGKVFCSGSPVVVNTEAERAGLVRGYDADLFARAPLVSAPLSASGGIVGVLNVSERIGGRPFEPDELEYLELIAKVAAGAIHDVLTREAHDRASDSIMVALAKLAEHRDNDTGRHLDRVVHYCTLLAEELRNQDKFTDQIDDASLHSLARAVPLHDIGKVAIPDEILLFPGKLSAEQMDVMRGHTTVGANTIQTVIARSPGVAFLDMAADVAHHHHEWYDGSGYPVGLKGEAIPLSARIAALADVYDALTTKRVYKEPFTHEKDALIIVESSGTQFDPAVVEAFLRCEKEFIELSAAMADDAPDAAVTPAHHQVTST